MKWFYYSLALITLVCTIKLCFDGEYDRVFQGMGITFMMIGIGMGV